LYFIILKKSKSRYTGKSKEAYPVQHLRTTGLIDSAELVIDDDRHNIVAEDKVLLVVEDDLRFTKILIDKAHDFDVKVVVAISYLEIFDSIIKYNPIAITLDVNMPNPMAGRY